MKLDLRYILTMIHQFLLNRSRWRYFLPNFKLLLLFLKLFILFGFLCFLVNVNIMFSVGNQLSIFLKCTHTRTQLNWRCSSHSILITSSIPICRLLISKRKLIYICVVVWKRVIRSQTLHLLCVYRWKRNKIDFYFINEFSEALVFDLLSFVFFESVSFLSNFNLVLIILILLEIFVIATVEDDFF